MLNDRAHSDQPAPSTDTQEGQGSLSNQQKESICAALAYLLGPETDNRLRERAIRRLVKQGAEVVPLILTTLHHYPEITTPAWPWWPPQYECCGYLLMSLSLHFPIKLEDMLQHPLVEQSPGPVLWISIMEAARLLPHDDHEALLRQGMNAPWMMVRCAAAMALVQRARKASLAPATIAILCEHQGEYDAIPVRLASSVALLTSGEHSGLSVLMQLMDPSAPLEARKAATFVLADEFPLRLTSKQRKQITAMLLCSLQDANPELAQHAAYALAHIARPSMLSSLYPILTTADEQQQIAALILLEELAKKRAMRQMIHHYKLPAQTMQLLQSVEPEVRRQACYTLAACGGEHVMAFLGAIVCNKNHIAHSEVIEGLRIFHGVLHADMRKRVVRWLLYALQQDEEERQITVLDSLAYLLLQARLQAKKRAWNDISIAIMADDSIMHLLDDTSAWVRQRAIELLGLLEMQILVQKNVHHHMLRLLQHDDDSGVRACAAFICGQINARWAIPPLILTLLDEDDYVALTAFHALIQLVTSEDTLLFYVIKELTHFSDAANRSTHALSSEAAKFLKRKKLPGGLQRINATFSP